MRKNYLTHGGRGHFFYNILTTMEEQEQTEPVLLQIMLYN